MLSILRSVFLGLLSLNPLNNTEFINHHNSLNLSYQVTENKFIEREYINEFYPSENHFIITNSTNEIITNESLFIPDSIDWRENHKVSSVKDQEKCGGCWAFSSTGSVESAYAIKNNILYNLSQQELLDCSYLNHGCNGGAMDLAVGAKQVFVMTEHCTKNGEPKISKQCSYPLTGEGVVDTIFTELAVIDITDQGLVVREKISEITLDELQDKTAAPLTEINVCELQAPDL